MLTYISYVLFCFILRPHEVYQLAFYYKNIAWKPYANLFDWYNDTAQLAADNFTEAFRLLQSNDHISRNFLKVSVVIDDELHIVSQKPILEVEGLIGTLGGLLNLWVGVSFITIVEIIDTVIKCCLFLSTKNKLETDTSSTKRPIK